MISCLQILFLFGGWNGVLGVLGMVMCSTAISASFLFSPHTLAQPLFFVYPISFRSIPRPPSDGVTTASVPYSTSPVHIPTLLPPNISFLRRRRTCNPAMRTQYTRNVFPHLLYIQTASPTPAASPDKAQRKLSNSLYIHTCIHTYAPLPTRRTREAPYISYPTNYLPYVVRPIMNIHQTRISPLLLAVTSKVDMTIQP